MSMRPATRGILWMSASELVFVAAWASIKILGRHLPLFEVTLFRAASSLALLVPLVWWQHGSFRGRAWKTLFWRAFFGYIAMLLSFYSMIHMDIGNASTLINTMPIFVAVLAPITLRERFSRAQFALVALSFGGVALLLKADAGVFDSVAAFALLAAFFAALAMLCLRKLKSSDSALIITFYFTAFSTVASLPLGIAEYVPPTPFEWWLVALIGVSATLGQIFLSKAYKLGNAATIAPFAYVAVIGCYAAGILVFGEIPDLWSIAGAAIIIACGIGIMLLAPSAQHAAEEVA